MSSEFLIAFDVTPTGFTSEEWAEISDVMRDLPKLQGRIQTLRDGLLLICAEFKPGSRAYQIAKAALDASDD